MWRVSLSKRTRGSLLSLAYVASTATSNLCVCSCNEREIRTNVSPITRRSLLAFHATSGVTVKQFPPSLKHNGAGEIVFHQIYHATSRLQAKVESRPHKQRKGMLLYTNVDTLQLYHSKIWMCSRLHVLAGRW